MKYIKNYKFLSLIIKLIFTKKKKKKKTTENKVLMVVASFVFHINTAIKIAVAVKLSKGINTSAFFCQLLFIHNYSKMPQCFMALTMLE